MVALATADCSREVNACLQLISQKTTARRERYRCGCLNRREILRGLVKYWETRSGQYVGHVISQLDYAVVKLFLCARETLVRDIFPRGPGKTRFRSIEKRLRVAGKGLKACGKESEAGFPVQRRWQLRGVFIPLDYIQLLSTDLFRPPNSTKRPPCRDLRHSRLPSRVSKAIGGISERDRCLLSRAETETKRRRAGCHLYLVPCETHEMRVGLENSCTSTRRTRERPTYARWYVRNRHDISRLFRRLCHTRAHALGARKNNVNARPASRPD